VSGGVRQVEQRRTWFDEGINRPRAKHRERMKFNLIEEKELTDFEIEVGHQIVVTERKLTKQDRPTLKRYYAMFENCDVMDCGTLVGVHGNGNTIDEALKDYCEKVSNCRVAFNAHTDKRKEELLPRLKHTKHFGI
jgi:hypothetical protein